MGGQQPATGIEAEVAQRGETHVKAELGVEQTVHLLQLGGDFPLRDTVVVEGQAVEHHRVQMDVHQARHQRCRAAVDDFRSRRDLDLALDADLLDAPAFEHDDRILDRLAAIAVDQQATLQNLDCAPGFRGFEFEHQEHSSALLWTAIAAARLQNLQNASVCSEAWKLNNHPALVKAKSGLNQCILVIAARNRA